MLYTAEEVLDFLEEEDVRFVRLAFCDIFGTPRNISIPPAELKSAFQTGVSFDASSVPGFTDVSHSDLFLYPDPTTLALFPWRPSNGRVVRMFCDIKLPNGEKITLLPEMRSVPVFPAIGVIDTSVKGSPSGSLSLANGFTVTD